MKYLFFILLFILLRCGYPKEYAYINDKAESRTYGLEVFLDNEKITENETTSAHLRIILSDGEKEEAETEKIEWISEKSEIAFIDESGIITGKKKGFSWITAYYNEFSSSTFIEVEEHVDCDRIVISEVFYNAVGSDSGKEYIEINNRNKNRCDLSGFSLVDGYSGSSKFILPEKSFLASGGYFIIVQDPEKFRQVFDVEPDISGLNFQLNNSGETITLIDSEMKVIERVYINGGYGTDSLPESWGDSSLPYASEGESVQRTASPDSDTYNDWFSGSPTPGY